MQEAPEGVPAPLELGPWRGESGVLTKKAGEQVGWKFQNSWEEGGGTEPVKKESVPLPLIRAHFAF